MEWFEVKQINDHLYIIRERLDKIEPKFRTVYTNMYLLIGTEKAALIDTGAGVKPILPTIKKYLGERDLLVFNTHNHFDHVGGNSEFPEVHIHKLDYKGISKPIDVSFLKDSIGAHFYKEMNFKIPVNDQVIPLIGGEKFDLGGIDLSVFHANGHTQGSIVLVSSEGEIFTGDTFHFGAFFYPENVYFEDYIELLEELYDKVEHFMEKGRLFPGHEDYDLPIDLLHELMFELGVIRESFHRKKYDEFLEAYIIENSNFTFVLPMSMIDGS